MGRTDMGQDLSLLFGLGEVTVGRGDRDGHRAWAVT